MQYDQAVDSIVKSVLESRKYRSIAESLIAEVARKELAKRPDFKEALKATKSKLHQVAGAFMAEHPRYDQWLTQLAFAKNAGEDAFMDACRKVMLHHSSTRERVPFLSDFYTTTLAGIGPVRSVLDIACGLNPLSIPWMPISESTEYYALDVYEDMMNFVASFLPLAGVTGVAEVGDLISSVPDTEVDVALVLKAIPSLEQIDPACQSNPRIVPCAQLRREGSRHGAKLLSPLC
jgi:16S rRNA (guanine(1405)-N(7))-methyltransferase